MMVWECSEALNKLAEDNQVTFLWISRYRGIKGNEIPYRLAKLATRQNPIGLEPVIGISNRSLIENIGKCLVDKHQKECHKATVCKQAKTEAKTLTEVFIVHIPATAEIIMINSVP